MAREKPLILLVDDEPDFLEIVSLKLNASGFETALARNGKEAVAQSGALAPDLILMDIHMPGETGTDVALIIKQNPKTKDMKIAFLTSLKDPWPTITADKTKLSQAMGMEDFIEKTEDLDVIVKKVREILAR
ncbi:MAG: hypothetical protein A2945_01120 [Candidatus Liptonbacteria bacterium RIFCSPLOWO2_01_FULL_52_25]|uniref:Response regulatory domain-containing protein n=1 Tax=Candidatus Liptonbacteria bacterium RIFCSPLOWO2_01_FULL_52_25 TaxID=1798650 RepID=A0A1G2CFL1_9BACT|nr:MAG: hypothetical protein A2945_01120 [Candidatus Liptonbacteria bacterium RIFCSPLOWO2_01_FULL_52_25]